MNRPDPENAGSMHARGARFLLPGEAAEGFALNLGAGVVLDVADPAAAFGLNGASTGVVAVSRDGVVTGSWGMAAEVSTLKRGVDLRLGPFAVVLTSEPMSFRSDGVRVISHPESRGGWRLLAVDASHEQAADQDREQQGRLAQALKQLGKALSMNQSVGPLCVAAVHEIASTAELAAVLLWRNLPDSGSMELAGSVGVNRQGATSLNRLVLDGSPDCAAKLVTMTRRPFFTASASGHVLTKEVEASFSYLRPGGVRVLPLEISGRLLGVLELVGREGDDRFARDVELHTTVAEQITLALNGAIMFEDLERLASHDPLTGLANHRALQEFLHWRIAECDRTGQSLGCLMIDVDFFRDFNEQEGHDAGDEVLRQVAEGMRSAVRPYDLAARYGGEEFTVLAPGASAAGVRSLAERIRDRIAARPFVTNSGREIPITVSIGCSVYPGQGSDAPSLLKAADVALYEAKRSGRNRVAGPDGGEFLSRAVTALQPILGDDAFFAGVERLSRHSRDIDNISMTLKLSTEQRAVLEALIVAAEAYKASPDTLLRAAETQPLAPMLEALNRPHDPEAPAPLLSRVLQAILATEQDAASGVVQMDPEIADLVARLRGS